MLVSTRSRILAQHVGWWQGFTLTLRVYFLLSWWTLVSFGPRFASTSPLSTIWHVRKLEITGIVKAYGKQLGRWYCPWMFALVVVSMLEGLNPRKAYCTPTKTAGSWFIDEPSQLRKKTGTISNRKVENFKGLWSHVNPRPTAILSLLSLFYCRIFKTFGTPILKENKIAIWAQ